MTLDNTSHPGRQGSDEGVPSRYPLRVGEIDVLVISDGVLSLPGKMLGHNADPAVRAAWLEDMFLPPDMLEWALNEVVVRSGGRTILINSGIGIDPGFNLPRAGKLVRRLAAPGIDLPIRDRRGVNPHAHGPRWRAARRRGEGPAAARTCGSTWRPPRPSSGGRPISPASPCRRGSRTRFGGRPSGSWTSTAVSCGLSRRSTRWPRGCSPNAPAAAPPGTAWSAWHPAATWLTFAGDLVFAPGFDHPDWYNGFEHDPREVGPHPGPSAAGAGGEPRGAGFHSPVVPVRLPCGGRRRRLSLGTGPLGVLTVSFFETSNS